MPPRKRKGPGRPPQSSSKTNRGRKRRSTIPSPAPVSPTNDEDIIQGTGRSKTKNKAKDDACRNNINSTKKDANNGNRSKGGGGIMYAISHHTSFIPALQCPNPLITQNALYNNINSSINSNIGIASNNTNTNSNTNDLGSLLDHSSSYNLYHPRNLGAQSMPIVKSDQLPPPHSAGCRLSSITCPSWVPIPQSKIHNQNTIHHNPSSSTSSNSNHYIVEGGEEEDTDSGILVKCTTVMNCNLEYVVMGDTSGHVTLYSIIPLFRPITVLETSNSRRYVRNNSNNIKSEYASNPSSATSTSTSTSRRTKRIGVTDNVLLSTIDRNYAIDTVALEKNGVIVGTKYEIEYVRFDNRTQWTLSIHEYALNEYDGRRGMIEYDTLNNNSSNNDNDDEDSREKKKDLRKIVRGAPTRFDVSSTNGGILASFELNFKPKRKKISDNEDGSDGDDDDDDEEGDSENDNNKGDPKDYTKNNTDADAGDATGLKEQSKEASKEQKCDEDDESKKENPLFSPVWHINTQSGQATNVIPKEYNTANKQWDEVIIGHRAMAIWDRSIAHANNILATFITQNQSTNEVQQELMLLNNDQQIIFRATLPTRSSGTKLITCEAINQSQRGAYSIAATSARGGIRLFKTDGLVHLGTYGEGVSLHGHSIFWQDCFFIEMGNVNDNFTTASFKSKSKHCNIDDDEACNQEQWGQIFERNDELLHRGAFKEEEIEKIKAGEEESLKGLHIVSVPHAFREPVDMKETIHFWDASLCEHDGGNKLPSFTLIGPKRSGGIITLLHDKNFPTSDGSRFLLSTYSGDCVQLAPTMTTDWAGQMYPTGYRVLENNLVYIEDEDELDKVVDNPIDDSSFCKVIETTWGDTVKVKRDSELENVLRHSMEDEIIDVVNDETVEDIGAFLISGEKSDVVQDIGPLTFPSCRPEPRLKEKLKCALDGSETTTFLGKVEDDASNGNDALAILRLFPQATMVENFLKGEEEKSKKRNEQIEAKLANDEKSGKEKAPKPRNRFASIEAAVNACTSKELSILMLKREEYSNVSGCLFVNKDTKNEKMVVQSQQNIDINCPACRGRKVIHSCGKRVKPIDYDAIEKARKEEEEKVRKAKLEAQAKKRKEAELKRREAKRKQKEQEEQAKEEEEKIKKEMMDQARNALVATESSFDQNSQFGIRESNSFQQHESFDESTSRSYNEQTESNGGNKTHCHESDHQNCLENISSRTTHQHHEQQSSYGQHPNHELPGKTQCAIYQKHTYSNHGSPQENHPTIHKMNDNNLACYNGKSNHSHNDNAYKNYPTQHKESTRHEHPGSDNSQHSHQNYHSAFHDTRYDEYHQSHQIHHQGSMYHQNNPPKHTLQHGHTNQQHQHTQNEFQCSPHQYQHTHHEYQRSPHQYQHTQQHQQHQQQQQHHEYDVLSQNKSNNEIEYNAYCNKKTSNMSPDNHSHNYNDDSHHFGQNHDVGMEIINYNRGANSNGTSHHYQQPQHNPSYYQQYPHPKSKAVTSTHNSNT